MKKINLFLCILFFTITGHGKDIIPLPELQKPLSILIDKNHLYIKEKLSVSIYSLKDFKIIRKFGREGEGPQEFTHAINLHLCDDFLAVVSYGKISYFNRNGEFIREKKVPIEFFPGVRLLSKELFVLLDRNRAERRTISIYDSNFKKRKVIYRESKKHPRGEFITNRPKFSTYKNKIFIVVENEFVIDVLNSDGEKLYSIRKEYKRIKFTNKHKKEIFRSFKANPETRTIFPIFEKNTKFPDYFPAISSFSISNDKIYLRTYKKSNGKDEFLIFNVNGQYIKRVFLSIIKMYGDSFPYPFTVYNGNLYQLIDNEDLEQWELHITSIH